MSETKFYTCKNDRAFKEVFMRDDSKDILTKLLESILDVKVEKIRFLNLERNVDNIYVRRKHFDLFLETNIGKIQVEVNAEDPNYLHSRNASFVFDTYSHEVKRGEEYTEDTLVIQINLSYSIKIEELVRIYKVRDEKGNEYIKNLIIYDINMDKIKDIWYSNSKREIEKYKYLIMLDLNQKELRNLEKLSQDRSVYKYMETLEEVNKDPEFREFMSAEEDNRKIENSLRREAIESGRKEGLEQGIKEGIEQGLEQGIEQGIEQGSTKKALEIAKSMITKGMDMDLISELTGLSKENLEKIQ